MFYHVRELINPIVADEPDPSAANALQEGLGGQFGEMRTMMQYLFQSFNFRGNAAPYRDLIQSVGIEEISHVELITKTISQLLDGSPRYQGDKFSTPGAGGEATMDMAKDQMNPHHFIVGAQAALPVDAAGNPWQGSYVHAHGNLVLDLLDNLVLEATGRLQKCRIYQGINRQQYHFNLQSSQLATIFQGSSPANDGTELEPMAEPDESYPDPGAPERPEEFSPGLDPELQALVDALTEYKETTTKKAAKKNGKKTR